MRFAFHRELVLGRFVPLDTPVHRLDPRTKLLAFVALVAVLLRVHGGAALLLAAGVLLAAFLAKLPLGSLLQGLRALTGVIVITMAYYLFWMGRQLGYAAGASAGAEASLGLVTMLLAAVVLTHSTEPVRLADGLARLFRFLEPLRVPVREIALVLTLAMRFLPTVLEEAQRLVLAQRARGARFTGGPLTQSRRFLPLAVPLFAGCLHRADTLALAMEARGFSSARRRTQFEPLVLRTADVGTLLGVALVLTAALRLPT
jgi:energy-coupling factor transport system permease protein